MTRRNPAAISPTAHYTGYVWYAHGLSHEAYATGAGRLLHGALRGGNALARLARLPSLDGMLLARHQLIDLRLHAAIAAGEVAQIVEVAAGLSPRGWRFARRYGDAITYVEADLPAMAARKRQMLASIGDTGAHHRVVEVDALADRGPRSIDAVCAGLDPSKPTAIVTEGLINYFDRTAVTGMWQRFAAALHRFPRGRYLSDVMLADTNRGPASTAFAWLLAAFVRGRVHLPFDTADDAQRALAAAGFTAALHDPRSFADQIARLEPAGAARVRIIEATRAP